MPVVGGRLRLFMDAWVAIGAPPSVLDIVKGYCIPFTGRPPLSLPTDDSYTHLRQPEHVKVIDEEVEALLGKGAIEVVSPKEPGYFSKMFVVPKPVGWRPIINLKRLNAEFIDCPHFRMDTVADVALLLRPGDWCGSIDLKDAYFHIPINRRFRRFLRFGWKGRLFQFLVLPFGLCTAPLIFTKVTKPLKAFLHSLGIRSIWYLDDVLIIGSSREECLRNIDEALRLLERVGFVVNQAKSSLIPSQDFRFLGLQWNTSSGVISIDDDKRLSVVNRASAMLSSPQPRCRDLQQLLGHMTAIIPAVPLIRLHCRFLQRDLNSVYRLPADANRRVALSEESLRDLSWSASLESPQCQKPMWPIRLEDCDIEVWTDASDEGWGIYFQGHLHHGLWTEYVDAPAHINAKELLALDIFLTDFLPPSAGGRKLLWRTDSSTALAYIRKEGGTVSPLLLQMARKIVLFLHHAGIQILPTFVSSEENLLADAASRRLTPPDWHLPAAIFDLIVDLWGLPEIDLFASQASAHLPRFFAWGNASGAEAFDALAQPWTFRQAYAFPPPPLLLRVSRKIAASSGVFLLVTPHWPAQKWFPALLGLDVVDVRRLPEIPPVIDLSTGALPLPHLPLLVWKILGSSSVSASPTPPSASSPTAGEAHRQNDMTPCGSVSRTFCLPGVFSSIPSL